MYIRLAISISLKSVFGASHFFKSFQSDRSRVFSIATAVIRCFSFLFSLLHGRDVVYFFLL